MLPKQLGHPNIGFHRLATRKMSRVALSSIVIVESPPFPSGERIARGRVLLFTWRGYSNWTSTGEGKGARGALSGNILDFEKNELEEVGEGDRLREAGEEGQAEPRLCHLVAQRPLDAEGGPQECG